MHDDTPDAASDGPESRTPIPEFLHSAFAEGPFTKCDACGAALRERPVPYQLQKTVKRGDVVFEIALCLPCLMGAMRDFSEESMERIRRFHEERYRPSDRLDECHFCRAAVGPESEYEIGAVCAGVFLARDPVVMCANCGGELSESLSKRTRDAWGEFLDDHVPGVPKEMEPDTLPMAF